MKILMLTIMLMIFGNLKATDYELKVTKSDEVLVFDLLADTEITFTDLDNYELNITTVDGEISIDVVDMIKIDFSDLTPIEQEQVFEKMGLTLFGNYPNPFNPSTTINFQTMVEGFVNISVYNQNGQLISKLLDENLAAGKHSIVWNSENQNVSSGVYFLKVEQNNQLVSTKMLLMK
ncbi:MAG: T9SS type A sorting domain-containing protein [Candidatus Delongbacteria bacterium]|nr:T9SS type A sorting domain-containing protein [Candidatus Delongbacteria bacterium]MBN2834492.1 T9SS type A sorting domain-containing protein [Candidatus Delongbacteria bacterium]